MFSSTPYYRIHSCEKLSNECFNEWTPSGLKSLLLSLSLHLQQVVNEVTNSVRSQREHDSDVESALRSHVAVHSRMSISESNGRRTQYRYACRYIDLLVEPSVKADSRHVRGRLVYVRGTVWQPRPGQDERNARIGSVYRLDLESGVARCWSPVRIYYRITSRGGGW